MNDPQLTAQVTHMRWAVFLLSWIFAASGYAQGTGTLTGTVLDSTGSVIAGAKVEFRSDAGTRLATTNAQGEFSIPDVTGGGSLLVRYPGFAPVTRDIEASRTGEPLRVVLSPAPSVERIQVSAGPVERISPVPASEYGIPRQEIQVSGGLSVDEILRQVPGFTLFRRSGSLFANPTAQGVSLRGVGANGTSRAAVLVDGIPLNDPFGGWVYWNRIPRAAIESLEVVNGGSSDVYGGGALGGVINIRTRPVRSTFGSLEASYGSEDTPFLSFDAGAVLHKWAISVDGQALRTGGYIIVPEDLRGAVDTPAGSGDLAGSVEISRQLGDQGRFFVRAGALGESRRNGTPVQNNDTTIPEIDLGLDWTHSTAGTFSVRAYGTKEIFHQTFSSVASNRNSEFLTDRQRSPSGQLGIAAQWLRTFAGRHAVTAGFEARGVHGDSFEQFFSASGPTAIGDSGGRQIVLGFFGQDAFHFAENWMLTVGGRVDTWSNSSGYSYRIPVSAGTPTSSTFADRRETAFSPRISLLRTFGSKVSASASVYRAFRAPNLNELYRGFRVGSAQTNANAALVAERLTGGEAGVSATPWADWLTLRGNFFWSEIANPVSNVTLCSNPNTPPCSSSTPIVRQRQNLGKIRARGFELSAEAQLPRHLRLTTSYIMTMSTVIDAPGNPDLIGLQVQQVPKNQFNFQWSYVDRNWTAGIQGRFVGLQYDNDLNTLPLEKYFTMDAEVSRRLLSHAQIFFGVQNMTNSRYQTARAGVLNIGPPALARGGLRFNLP
jgi:outer membrane receptor protein involved in Fe transport